MFLFQFIKTYLMVGVAYLLWTELMYQVAGIGHGAHMNPLFVAYLAAIFMVLGTFIIVLVDWVSIAASYA
jgi:hypothetical protein